MSHFSIFFVGQGGGGGGGGGGGAFLLICILFLKNHFLYTLDIDLSWLCFNIKMYSKFE